MPGNWMTDWERERDEFEESHLWNAPATQHNDKTAEVAPVQPAVKSLTPTAPAKKVSVRNGETFVQGSLFDDPVVDTVSITFTQEQ